MMPSSNLGQTVTLTRMEKMQIRCAEMAYKNLRLRNIDTSSVNHFFSTSSSSTSQPSLKLLNCNIPLVETIVSMLDALDNSSSEEQQQQQLQHPSSGSVVENIGSSVGHVGFVQHSSTNNLQSNALLPDRVDDCFSRDTIIDTTLLHNATRGDVTTIRLIYEHIAYTVKMPYMTPDDQNVPTFAMKKMKVGTDQTIYENILYMPPQSSKSCETGWAAWCSFFIMGCLPVSLVRNNGGLVQGKADAKKAIEDINTRVNTFLQKQGRSDLESKRFCLTCVDKVEDIQFRGEKAMDGQVLIM